jgi:heterodisulfide reductase subunit D
MTHEETALTLERIKGEFDQCIKCGLCLASCPVCKELLLEKYTPRGKVQLARYYVRGDLGLSDHYREIYARCLLCGACVATCPSGVDLRSVFLTMRSRVSAERGVHPALDGAMSSLSDKYNIAGEANDERGDWREDLRGLPAHGYEKARAEVAYFIGCVASFFPMVQVIPRNLVSIMDRAGVDFAILAGEEWCCGYPFMGAGLPEEVERLKAHNLEKVKAMGARKVVFSCPSCYLTWKEHYGSDLELFHSTELLANLVTEGMVNLKELPMTVTYHDPCDLGRGSQVYDAPRRIIEAIPGVKLVEMDAARAKSVCCGGGGNLEMADPKLSAAVAQKKIEQILRTGAQAVITSCQQCVRTIKAQARRQKTDLQVLDITELVLKAMS